jgi:hypothetical protein
MIMQTGCSFVEAKPTMAFGTLRMATRSQQPVESIEMGVLVELRNTGDASIGQEVRALVEHALSDRPGDWRVSIRRFS